MSWKSNVLCSNDLRTTLCVYVWLAVSMSLWILLAKRKEDCFPVVFLCHLYINVSSQFGADSVSPSLHFLLLKMNRTQMTIKCVCNFAFNWGEVNTVADRHAY